MAPPTGLENAHVPCIGVALLWRAKNRKNNLLEAGRMKCKWGKTLTSCSSSRGAHPSEFFFLRPMKWSPPARRELGQVNHQR
jgi:hypothetical protein